MILSNFKTFHLTIKRTIHNWLSFFLSHLLGPLKGLSITDHPFLYLKRTSFCFYKNALNRFWKSGSAIRLGLPTFEMQSCVLCKTGLLPFKSPCATYSYRRFSGSSRVIQNRLSHYPISQGLLKLAVTYLGSRGNYAITICSAWRLERR